MKRRSLNRVNVIRSHIVGVEGQGLLVPLGTGGGGHHHGKCHSGSSNRNCGGTSSKRNPLRVLITGAAGQIAYSLLPMIASGRMLGPHQPLILHLLDIPPVKAILDGVVMELEDCAFPLIKGIVSTTDVKTAFDKVDIAILVGSFPRREGMERKELLERNIAIFKEQGKALNDYSSKDVKVLVVGNPANTNCLTTINFAPNLPRSNFSCLTRLDQNRAKAQIALKLNTPIDSVHNIIIWGNHSSTQYPDLRYGYVKEPGTNIMRNVSSSVNDDSWTQSTFVPSVQQRGAKVIQARKLSSAASAANAIVDHIRDWILGTRHGEIVSMGVYSDGSYGIQSGLVYSFPVTCADGRYSIVKNLEIDARSRELMKKTEAELLEEKNLAFSILGQK